MTGTGAGRCPRAQYMAVLTFLQIIAPGEVLLREKWQRCGPWVVGRQCHSVFGWVKCLNGPSPLPYLPLRLFIRDGVSRSSGGLEPGHTPPHGSVISKSCWETHGPEWLRRPNVGYPPRGLITILVSHPRLTYTGKLQCLFEQPQNPQSYPFPALPHA